MGFAIMIGVKDYRVDSWIFFEGNVNLRPDLVSGLFSAAIVAALYFRGVWIFRRDLLGLVSAALNLTIVAILIQALLGNTATWLTSLPMPYLVGFAAFATWTSLKAVAPFIWLVTMFMGLINLTSASDAMGILGFLMVLCVALAVILETDYLPSGEGDILADFMRRKGDKGDKV